jgi:hypothetical protein
MANTRRIIVSCSGWASRSAEYRSRTQRGSVMRWRVEAESLYDAVAVAAKSFDEHNVPPPAIDLAIEVATPPVTQTVKLKTVHEWANTPREVVLRQRVKELLEGLSTSQVSPASPLRCRCCTTPLIGGLVTEYIFSKRLISVGTEDVEN